MSTLLEERISKNAREIRKGLSHAGRKGIPATKKDHFLSLIDKRLEDIEGEIAKIGKEKAFARWAKKLELDGIKGMLKRLRAAVEGTNEFGRVKPLEETIARPEKTAAQKPIATNATGAYEPAQEGHHLWFRILETGKLAEEKAANTEEDSALGAIEEAAILSELRMKRRWKLTDNLIKIEKEMEILEQLEETSGEKYAALAERRKVVLCLIKETRKEPQIRRRIDTEVGRHNGYDNSWEGFVPAEKLLALSQWKGHIGTARLSEHFETLSTFELVREWKAEIDK